MPGKECMDSSALACKQRIGELDASLNLKVYAVQVYELSNMHFLPKDWIMERWEEGFYITAMAGSQSGASLVVMSKGTPYTQQSYKVPFPPKWLWKIPS